MQRNSHSFEVTYNFLYNKPTVFLKSFSELFNIQLTRARSCCSIYGSDKQEMPAGSSSTRCGLNLSHGQRICVTQHRTAQDSMAQIDGYTGCVVLAQFNTPVGHWL